MKKFVLPMLVASLPMFGTPALNAQKDGDDQSCCVHVRHRGEGDGNRPLCSDASNRGEGSEQALCTANRGSYAAWSISAMLIAAGVTLALLGTAGGGHGHN
ncbi:MAG: hypothetical protein KGZ39_05115 [Simkania sp.]|nr:hypothetical protein [Simkania sp.]